MALTRIIPAKSLAETAADQIRDAILSGTFRLGEKISEDRVVEMLGVSRTPIRDAMALLTHEGLVVVRPKRGTFVFETSPDDIKAICTYREIIETQGVRVALHVARDAYLAELSSIVAKMQSALDGDDADAYGRLDTRFHNAAFDHCGNSYLRDANALVTGRIAALRANITAPYAARRAESFQEHKMMTSLLPEGRMDDFDTLLRCHIARTETVYSRALADGHLGGNITMVEGQR
ncbi:GntR family transcriptional regulator [Roseicitreum antarcticum]|uniref:DNA-binding transcriptional regulator, GntR family n=1 Tax=Roseicitreum antarcticum TaxID=564137 RepID=A0A1H2VII6_9RHOB|nr:GntR family transcriptional regulator [Roseicitreum antarcticum]SDW67754.1 DNA-binding transcriptional regulator, GntR family [Roseicitreum antarcticum]